MEFKFEIGQKVRVLDGSKISDYSCGWNPRMIYDVGKIVTITKHIDSRRYPAYRVAETDWSYDERGLAALSDIGNVKKIIFNDPATIILWEDGTKTVVKAHNEPFDPEKGVAMCFMKKACDNKSSFNNVFKKWIPDDKKEKVSHKALTGWTPCSSNNPSVSGDYIAITASGLEMEISYSKTYDMWNAYDHWSPEAAKEHEIKVLVWRNKDDSES
jgi:hypothetical protein